MTRPLDEVDKAVIGTWFAAEADPDATTRELIELHRTLQEYTCAALARDLPPSWARDRAMERLREAWHWTLSCLTTLGPIEPCSDSSPPSPSSPS